MDSPLSENPEALRASGGGVANIVMEKIVLKFEELENDVKAVSGIFPRFLLYRAKVPGGWLVILMNAAGTGGSVTFVPDPNHTWDGSSLR